MTTLSTYYYTYTTHNLRSFLFLSNHNHYLSIIPLNYTNKLNTITRYRKTDNCKQILIISNIFITFHKFSVTNYYITRKMQQNHEIQPYTAASILSLLCVPFFHFTTPFFSSQIISITLKAFFLFPTICP